MKKKMAYALPISLFMVLAAAAANAEVKVSYLYNLSDFFGTIPYNWPRMAVDDSTGEVYALSQNNIKVFSGTGMEVYEFGDSLDIGGIIDITIDEESNIYLLAYQGNKYSVVRCNYRGEPTATLAISKLPADLAEFRPYRMIYQKGNLYFLAPGSMKVVLTDREGNFKDIYDIKPLLQLDEKQKKADMDIIGFTVDSEGNMVFTIPVLFAVFKLTPDRKLTSFGEGGNLAGKFNVAGGVAVDKRGGFIVTDILRSTVSVFDKDYKFLTQFGHRGVGRDNLFSPNDVVVDNSGKIYVSQAMSKGISVFRVTYE